MDYDRDTEIQWDLIGDIKGARPTLGTETSIALYRLMQLSLKAVLEREFGDDVTDYLVNEAGRLAGGALCRNLLNRRLGLEMFIDELRRRLRALNLGLLRVETIDEETSRFYITLEEPLDCSGTPARGPTTCRYTEGLLAGIFEAYRGRRFVVKEIDCSSSGGRACRFTAEPLADVEELGNIRSLDLPQ